MAEFIHPWAFLDFFCKMSTPDSGPNRLLLNDPMWSPAVELAAFDMDKEIIENIPNEINDFDMSGNLKEEDSTNAKIYKYSTFNEYFPSSDEIFENLFHQIETNNIENFSTVHRGKDIAEKAKKFWAFLGVQRLL